MSRCLDPQTPPEKVFRGSKLLLRRYLEDFGRLGYTIYIIYIHTHYSKQLYYGSHLELEPGGNDDDGDDALGSSSY